MLLAQLIVEETCLGTIRASALQLNNGGNGTMLGWVTMCVDSYPVRVIRRDGQVVAWGMLEPAFMDGYRHSHTNPHISVFVHHLHRREGLGRLLAISLLDLARQEGHGSIRVRCDPPGRYMYRMVADSQGLCCSCYGDEGDFLILLRKEGAIAA